MHLILTGATGLVGSGVLDAMLKMRQVSQITILSRRAVRMADDARDPRVRVVVHPDFEKYDDDAAPLLRQILGDAHGCVWALGVSQSQVGKEEYIKITKDYPLRFVEALQQARSDHTNSRNIPKSPFHFVYVSGEGATHTPGPFTPLFGRVKGEAEIALGQLARASSHPEEQAPPGGGPSLLAVTTVRPAFVDASTHAGIQPYVPAVNAGGILRRGMLTLLGPVVRNTAFLRRDLWSPTEPLGRFLTELAMGEWQQQEGEEGSRPGVEKGPGESRIFGNAAFVRLSGVGTS